MGTDTFTKAWNEMQEQIREELFEKYNIKSEQEEKAKKIFNVATSFASETHHIEGYFSGMLTLLD